MPISCLPVDTMLIGIDETLDALREVVSWPAEHGVLAGRLGVRWPKGLLLHGPPGCGKTAAVHAVAHECGAIVHVLTAASVVAPFLGKLPSFMVEGTPSVLRACIMHGTRFTLHTRATHAGEAERRLRAAFAAANRDAQAGCSVIVFLDEVDTLCPHRSDARQHDTRVVGQLLALIDGTVALRSDWAPPGQPHGHVVVVGATSRPNAVDPALRRAGRLEREVCVQVPSSAARYKLLQSFTAKLPVEQSLDLQRLAGVCHGYTAADLSALCREAVLSALSLSGKGCINDVSTSHKTHLLSTGRLAPVGAEHFTLARTRVLPSLARGITVEYPETSWGDIGGLPSVKHKLKQAVEWPLRHAKSFQRLGLLAARGVLLYGPPGCSKTSLVRAAASESGATLLSLSGTHLYSMYVGEGEAHIRDTFRRARLVAPAIIFMDELDAVVGKRVFRDASTDSTARLLSSLLTEIDGLESSQRVVVIGATNRPKAIDAALVRPGRFDVLLYVPPPDDRGRLQALQIHSKGIPLGSDVDLQRIASLTTNFTGAEIAALCREASMAALREDVETVRFKDKAREKQRQTTMQQQKRDVGGPRCPSATRTRAIPAKLHAPAAKRRKVQDKENLDELARDYRLLKRLKRES